MPKKISNLKISVSGVRGVVGETLTPKLISSFSAAFGRYVGPGPVVIGRDTRPTGQMVEQAVLAGLLSVGCQPVLAGVIPTPTVQVLVDRYQAVGGIAITASHNPMSWNAMKFINGKGMFLGALEASQVLDIYNQESEVSVPEEDIPLVKKVDEPFAEHENRIYKEVDLPLIRQKKFKVAMDCGNGAGAPFSKSFLENLGCEVVLIHDEMDGRFRRKPEPIPENLSILAEVVKKEKCDIGFAQDPDADRLVLVDNNGVALNENYTLALAVKHILQKSPSPVTINLGTSKMIQDIVEEAGQTLHLTKIGEIHVSTAMLENGSAIGGEGNGGVIYPAVRACRDSFTGMALALELLATTGKTVAELVDSMPKYYGTTKKITMSSDRIKKLLSAVKEKYEHLTPITLDGVRLTWPDKWIIFRASNTEPIIRIQAEASSEDDLVKLLEEFDEFCQ